MNLPEDLTDCPYYLITRASLTMTGYLKRQLATAGVGLVRPAYLGVLMSLWREDRLKVVELGRRAGLEPSTMTGLVDRMERDGLVVRTPDPDDRRAQRIQLTGEGRRVEQAVSKVVDHALTEVMQGVPEEDLDGLKSILQRVLSNTQGLSKA